MNIDKSKRVFLHTTGNKLNTADLKAWIKENPEATPEQVKTAMLNDFENHGHFTKKEGKGTFVKSTIGVGGHGRRVIYDKTALTEDELSFCKDANFKRLAQDRATKLVKAIKALCNTANESVHNWTDEQATEIMNAATSEMQILENKLFKVGSSKKKGYAFKFSA